MEITKTIAENFAHQSLPALAKFCSTRFGQCAKLVKKDTFVSQAEVRILLDKLYEIEVKNTLATGSMQKLSINKTLDQDEVINRGLLMKEFKDIADNRRKVLIKELKAKYPDITDEDILIEMEKRKLASQVSLAKAPEFCETENLSEEEFFSLLKVPEEQIIKHPLSIKADKHLQEFEKIKLQLQRGIVDFFSQFALERK